MRHTPLSAAPRRRDAAAACAQRVRSDSRAPGRLPGQLAGTIVAVVCCSMDAYLADDRRSATDGKNMARCYPGDPHGTLTERATQ